MSMGGLRARVGLAVVLSVVGAAACGGTEPVAPEGVPIPFRPAESGPTSFGDVPWPSDLYLDANGQVGEVPGLARVAGKFKDIQAGLSALDGFGRSTGALFFVDASVDDTTLPRTWESAKAADVVVRIVDIDPASPQYGTQYPAYAKYLPTLQCISTIPVPGVVLPPGVRHAVVLTSDLHASTGEPFIADTELRRIAALAAGDRSTPVELLYGDALERLVSTAAVATSDDVASVAVFTTSRRAEELPALRERLRDLPAPQLIADPAAAAPYTVAVFGSAQSPTLDEWLGIPDVDDQGMEWPGGDNPGGIAHDQIGAVLSGAFVAPSFRDPTTHHFERDGEGVFVLAEPAAQIPVTLVVPKTPPPASGYPVIISGHGLSNNRGSMFSFANEMARAGFAVIGIDDVEHGFRADLPDLKNNFKGTFAGPDGISDELPLAVSFFAGFADFVAVRDNFRQTVLDQTSLVRLIENPDLDLSPLAVASGGEVPKLDPTRIYWSGGSLGGIVGAMTTAVEPKIIGAALHVPGASFVHLITTNSAMVASLVGTLATSIFGIQGDEVLDEFHPLPVLLAAVTEAGDPISYAPHIMQNPLLKERTPPDLMITYAAYDELLPNISTEALIRALGVPLAEPLVLEVPGVATVKGPVSNNLENGKTAAAVQYAPATHGLGYSRYDKRQYEPGVPKDGEERFPKLPMPFTVEMPIREHASQLAKFFESASQGKAIVEVTAPPVADYDGDGVLDEADAAPWDPTKQ